MIKRTLGLGLAATLAASAHAAPPMANDYPIRPVAANHVQVADAFWKPRLEINRNATIPFVLQKCEDTGRIENFRVAGGLSQNKWATQHGYDDSDVSKVIEGAAYSLMAHPDKKLKERLAAIIDYYAAAQEDDGYLYTLWTARHTVDYNSIRVSPGSDRWGRIDFAHQLYNLGHMYEAGVAYWQATGNKSLLDVCQKSAECVLRNFGPGKIEKPPGHQEIEIGLVKLYRATGDKRCLDLAKFFLDIRGRQTQGRHLYGEQSQDHLPVIEQTEAVGHAVRACYMYAAMADIAALTGDSKYLAACDHIWRDVVFRKMYLTGGIGAVAKHEGFAAAYELPNLTAYCETCATIAMCLWNHRMYLMTGDAKYIDVLERSLYNGVLSGVSLDGTRFFYPNPLESDGSHTRSPWFSTSCCPTNICRFIPSVPGYAYAIRDDKLFVNLYIAGKATIEFDAGPMAIEVRTDYPWSGDVTLKIEDAPKASIAINFRIPGWAGNEASPGDLYHFADNSPDKATLELNGKPVSLQVQSGYASIQRKWQQHDVVKLRLPMPIRRVLANDAVAADRGRVALQRGPLVYCIEHPDVAGGRVRNLALSDSAQLTATVEPKLLGGVTVIRGTASMPQQAGEKSPHTPIEFQAIPYYAWAHRGPGEMTVWLTRTPN